MHRQELMLYMADNKLNELLSLTLQYKKFAEEIQKGLSSNPKFLPSKFIYDDNGSRLFEKIKRLPEYYLTNSEIYIFRSFKDEIAKLLFEKKGYNFKGYNIIELGAGNGEKMEILLNHFSANGHDFYYYPIDISEKALQQLLLRIRRKLPNVNTIAINQEYLEGLSQLTLNSENRNIVFFLGANIGNMDPMETKNFLINLKSKLNSGDLLFIGFDLVKDYRLIERAYNDLSGISEEFNFNILKRINNELGGNFNLNNFYFYNFYNPILSANQTYLVSKVQQEVLINALGVSICFKQWEPIKVECSYKYSVEDIESLAEQTEFELIHNYFDNKKYFTDSVWKVL